MEFKRLRLSGFKSFVEPAELRIEAGLTGVVGPNGCGKSNLLEAIRWLMGEGSAKSLRGGGMEDVIFAGTERRPARDFADVMLTLDNSERSAPAGMNDDDTIEVVRRIERGAGSAYRVNGRDVRQRDVQLLFADAATGAHSPALVSQGRIGAIIAAKPADRRVLLEEAAGISGLHVRRREAELRLRATEANLLRLDDVMKAMEAQANALRRAAKAAERYRALSDRIRSTEAQLLFAHWTAASAAAVAARALAAATDAEVADATRAAARVGAAQADAAGALPGLREAEARAAAALQRLRQTQNDLTAELAQVERQQRDVAQGIDTVRRDRAREAALSDDAVAALARLQSEAVALDTQAAAARAALPGAAARVAAAEASAASGEAALSNAIEAQARAAAQMRAATVAIETAEARASRARAEAARLTRERDSLGDPAKLHAQADAATSALAASTASAIAASAAIAAAETARADGMRARDAANTAVLEARGGLAALTAERDALARLLAGGGAARAGIIEQITVTPGFEAALAAALGDDLNAAIGGAAGRFWAGATGTGDPPLPGGTPLADHVAAPPELTRRLRSIAIVPDTDAEALAAQLGPGQRLVTTTGKLYRWDGFRAFGGQGEATAERLRQRNRLVAIATELQPAEASLAASTVRLSDGEAVVRAATEADRAARADRAAAERAQDSARRNHAAAVSELAALTSRADAMTAAIARLADDGAAHAREADAARAAAEAITDLAALTAAVTTVRGSVESGREALAVARAAHATLSRELDAGSARAAAIAADRASWAKRQAASAAHGNELDARAAVLVEDARTLAERPPRIALRQAELATEVHDADAARRSAADTLAAAEAALRALDADARRIADTLGSAREERARAATTADHEDARRLEVEARCGERFAMSPPRLPAAHGFADAGDAHALAHGFEALTAERDRLGPVNLRADTELAELEAIVTASTAERAELDTAIARLRGSIGALNREGRVRLLAAFERVDAHFRELFATLFAGGAAHLELVESDDPLEAGLEIMAQPPGKKLQSLTLLSGGEQALTAVALIFALFLTNPAPICVLDEVDAPLDDANVERFCDLLDRMAATTRTRFLIVTHNAVTMSRMHRLFGVTMAEPGVSQLVSVDLARAELLLAAE